MNDLNELPQLTHLGEKLSADGSFVSDVMQRIAHEPIAPPAPARPMRIWAIRSGAVVAACLLIAAGLWIAFSSSSNSLYAQAVKALEEAKTVHAVGNRWQDGKWVKGAEIFYQRGVGVYEWTEQRGREQIRIDDTKNEWRFSPSEPTVRKSPSKDPLGVVRKILDEARHLDRARRDDFSDRDIDGVRCRLYALAPEGGASRYRIWADDRMRIHRLEQDSLRDGKWQPVELSEVQYDVPIDAKIFVPQLPANARIIEADKLLDQQFAVASALYRQEALGMLFAVHRVERLPNGTFLVVTSLRPTDATRRELGNNNSGPLANNYATLIMMPSFRRIRGDVMRSYGTLSLAEVYHDGLTVQWMLFEPVGTWGDEIAKYDLSWRLSTDGKLADTLRSQGKQEWAEFLHAATLAAQPREGSVIDVAAAVYHEIEPLEPVAAKAHVELKSIKFTDDEMVPEWQRGTVPRGSYLHHGRSAPPSKISEADFLKDVRSRLDEATAARRGPL
jgi:outer membrane lipoprotein-sorting protein